MRPGVSRVFAGATLAAATLFAASACTSVDLTNEWPAMAAPTGWEPKAGDCHEGAFAETSYRNAYNPVDCKFHHNYETVHVGTFTGDAADLGAPPEQDSTALGEAWADCDKKTTEYFGGEWRDGLIWIGVSVPSRGNWEGGARWYRCEAAATRHGIGNLTDATLSIKGAAELMKRGCYQIPKDEDKDWSPVPCTAEHNAEFVGSFIATGSYEDLGKNTDRVHRKCRSLIAKYVGVPDDGKMKYRTGNYYSYPAKSVWEAGDRGVRCYLWFNDRKLTKSLKGGGTKALPI